MSFQWLMRTNKQAPVEIHIWLKSTIFSTTKNIILQVDFYLLTKPVPEWFNNYVVNTFKDDDRWIYCSAVSMSDANISLWQWLVSDCKLRIGQSLTAVPSGMRTATLSLDHCQWSAAMIYLLETIKNIVRAIFNFSQLPLSLSAKSRYRWPKLPAAWQSGTRDNLRVLSAHLSLYP